MRMRMRGIARLNTDLNTRGEVMAFEICEQGELVASWDPDNVRWRAVR